MLILDSHIEGAQEYSPTKRGEIYRAIIEYGYYGIEPDWLKGEAKGFFIAIKPTLDNQKARSDAGKASGRSRRANAERNASKPRTKAEQTANKSGANAEQTGEQNANEEEIEEEVFVSDETNSPIAPEVYAEIVGYLNARTGRSYKPGAEATRKLIRARLAEGFTVEDFKRVIDNKAATWLGDPKMDCYLRPETLFGKSKFEGYLNERPAIPKGGDDFADYAD